MRLRAQVGVLGLPSLEMFRHGCKPQLRVKICRRSYINPSISPLEFAPLEQDRTFHPLRTMGYVSIYPPSALRSQPPHLPCALTSLTASGASVASLSVCQTASELDQWNGNLTDSVAKSRGVSEVSQQSHFSDLSCRNGLIKEQGTRRELPSQSLRPNITEHAS